MRRTLLIFAVAALQSIVAVIPVSAQNVHDDRASAAPASEFDETRAQPRLVEKRIYTIYPPKYLELRDLVQEFQALAREETGRSFRFLTGRYGPQSVFVLEFEFADEDEQKAFWDTMYPLIIEKGWVDQWFASVQHWKRELWSLN